MTEHPPDCTCKPCRSARILGAITGYVRAACKTCKGRGIVWRWGGPRNGQKPTPCPDCSRRYAP